ncbi:hypothetical protein AAC387_Pa09g2038 [Persea americana]
MGSEFGSQLWAHQRFNGRLSTRSDEDGFGGIYGGNQKLSKEEEDKGGNEKHTEEYDKSQGSEVKEKERGRHQHEKTAYS